jgi:hypothetical protein
MRVLIINAKSSDLCNTEYIVDGETRVESDGYCPNIKGVGGGDYIELRIDLDTGKLLGYDPVSHKDVMDELTDEDDEWEEDEEVYEDGLNIDPNSPEVIDPKVLDASLNKLLDETDTYKLGF